MNKIFGDKLSFIPKKMTDVDIVTYRVVSKFHTTNRYQYNTQTLYYPMEFTKKWYQKTAKWNFIKHFEFPFYCKVKFTDSGFVRRYLFAYHLKKNGDMYMPVGEVDFDRYFHAKEIDLDCFWGRLEIKQDGCETEPTESF
jgi:hypothetical protein